MMMIYKRGISRKEVEKLRDRAQSCVNTYTPPAKIRTDAYELVKICNLLLKYIGHLKYIKRR